MIGIDQDTLIENLKRLQRKRCCSCSMDGEDCDCTFGVDLNYMTDSQKTGCLELRQVILILEKMNNLDFLKLCRLQGIEL